MRVSIASPFMQPSPSDRRVGIRIVTFEACSGFTRVTARRIAQPPKVTFVTRLQSRQSPSETARQLPDLSTIIWVEPSSTDDSRLQGALPVSDVSRCSKGSPRMALRVSEFLNEHASASAVVGQKPNSPVPALSTVWVPPSSHFRRNPSLPRPPVEPRLVLSVLHSLVRVP